MFGGCPEQYRRRYIERERTIPKAYLHVGTAVDKTIARNMRSKLDHGLLLGQDEIRDLAKTFFDKKVDEEGIEFSKEERAAGEAKAKTAAIEKSRRLVLAHHALLAPQITPARGKNLIGEEWIGIGRRFTIELDGYDFELAGEIDLAEEKIIRDTKTSGASPSKDTAHDSLQLSMYALAKLACDGELPEQLRLDYLIDLKKSTKVMSLPTVRTKESLQPLLHRVQTMHELIQAGSFGFARADDWRCTESYCGFWRTCRFAQHRPVSVAFQDYTAELSRSIEHVQAKKRRSRLTVVK